MENTSIILINCYFGRLPNYFGLFLNSCKYNSDIKFLIITDDIRNFKVPKNVEILRMSFKELKKKIDEKLDIKNNITRAYKLCDFKPAYGILFEENIKGYDFWGHCDIDLIFGDLRKFLTEEVLKNNNKILKRGHLTLYRNRKDINEYYKIKNDIIDYKKVFQDSLNYSFDEWNGIVKVLDSLGIKQYHEEFIADINCMHKKLKVYKGENYKKQVFFWKKGKVFRKYIDNNSINYEEFAYIHFQKRNMDIFDIDVDSQAFFITPKGFCKYIENIEYKDFKKYNRDSIKYYVKKQLERRKNIKKYLNKMG